MVFISTNKVVPVPLFRAKATGWEGLQHIFLGKSMHSPSLRFLQSCVVWERWFRTVCAAPERQIQRFAMDSLAYSLISCKFLLVTSRNPCSPFLHHWHACLRVQAYPVHKEGVHTVGKDRGT